MWSCAPLIDKFRKLRDDTISFFLQELSSHDRAPQNGPSNRFTRIFSELACWSLPHDTSTGFNFSHLVRGFVPTHLVASIQSIVGTTPNVNALVGKALSFAQSEFQANIWQHHIMRMLDFEKSKGITEKEKRSPFFSSGSVSISRVQQTASPIARWHHWITEYMNTGLPWQGFLRRINNLAL